MAPRRSAARASTVTPVQTGSPNKRSARGTSAVPLDGSVSRRVTRGGSARPSFTDDIVNNPRLPEVQTQQSYAYGSTKTPILPAQLVARERMNLKEMAETIDAGVRQAEKHFQDHAADTEATLQADQRHDGTRQRTSKDRSRDGSVDSDNLDTRKSERVAAWASSLDSSQIEQIPDETSERDQGTPEVNSPRDTEPSSFPSGISNHSYNYERGLRRPRVQVQSRGPSLPQKTWNLSKRSFASAYHTFLHLVGITGDWFLRLGRTCWRAIGELPESTVVVGGTKVLFSLCLVAATSVLFCYMYTTLLCVPLSTSTLSLGLQKFCGSCARPLAPAFNLTDGDRQDLSKLSMVLSNINSQIRLIESRLSDKFDSKYAVIEADIDALRRQQIHITNLMALLGSQQSSISSNNIPSPLIPKVNFFAPSNGALVDPRRTSPTRQKPFPLPQRVIMRMLGMTKYQARPPITALEAWQDVGDCWCSSDAAPEHDSVRLGVTVKELIYPTELVIEHYPSAGSLNPDSAPRIVEIWADFDHLDGLEWQQLNIRSMQASQTPQESNKDIDDELYHDHLSLGPTYALVGRAEYDASTYANHVQAFRLDVNQDYLRHYAQHFVVRVVRNYGAAHTCLYRVRLHGVPVARVPGDNEVT